MTTNSPDQPTLSTNENITNPSTSTHVPTNNEPINTASADELRRHNPPTFENPITGAETAGNTGAAAVSHAVDDVSKAATATHQEEKSTSPATTNRDHQVTDAQSSSKSTAPANDVTHSHPPKTPVSHDIQSEVFPPAPTNTLDDQMFNNTARAAFSISSDDTPDANDSDAKTSPSPPLGTTETNRSKKSPAPVAKSSLVDATKAQSPSDTTITINESSAEQQVPPSGNINTEPELVSPAPPAISGKKSALAARFRPSPRAILVFAVSLIIPLLQLIIGWHYADDCPIRWRIPHYLVVSGIIGLIVLLLPIVVSLLNLPARAQNNTVSPVLICGVVLLSLTTLVLTLFLFGWFIAGCIWVFRVFNKVQFQNANRADYCHPVLYRFACWLLLLTILFTLFNFYRSCTQVRKVSTKRNRDDLIAVPTSEP